ncbi:sel1 repeat family protein [Streptomyces sp. YC504]|uniref:Sel1 repeat family protein n=1 Tax=Streptomyces mesophilus TaxID=1775132 RepID=A0A6G4XAS8_9ACTN|nr:sel1 repeat family protein [Streptomyces mesophilus]NGO74656.1 sel1 repeat family protein [Streptomyces mesophilus]
MTHGETHAEIRDEEAELAAAAEAGQDGAYRAYATFLGKNGRMDQALPWWARAAADGDADAARTLAICHKDRWEFAEAERWYRSAADRDGGCAFGLGTLLKEAGDPDGAQEWYARGAALGNVQCLTNGAVLKAARHGAFAEAQAQLAEAAELGDHKAASTRQVIENFVDDLELWEDRLARAEADGDAEAAFEALSPLRDPEYAGMFTYYPSTIRVAEALYARAAAVGSHKALIEQAILVARDSDRFEEAHALAVRAHELGYSGAAYVLGVWAFERGDQRVAEQWFETAAAAPDGHDYARYYLGLIGIMQRRLDEAERWLRLTGTSEDEDDPYDGLPKMFVDQLEEIAAIRADPARLPDPELTARLPELRAAAEAGGPEECFAYADALERLYRLPDAADWYRRSGTPRALLDLGRMLQDCQADETLLVPYFEPAAEAGDARAAYSIAGIHTRAKDDRAAGIWTLKAAQLGHARAAWGVGWTSEERGGDPQFAERWYVRAAEGGLARPAFLAGRSMVRWGRYAEAEQWLQMAWENDIPEAAYHLGRALRRLGRTAQAEQWLRRAVERSGDFDRPRGPLASRPDPRPELAELLVEAERDEEAAPLVADILAEYPGHLYGHRLAGRLARRRGDLTTAEQHFAQIEERDSDPGTRMSLREIRELLAQVTHEH